MDFLREIKKCKETVEEEKQFYMNLILKNIKTILELVSKYLFVH